MGVLSLEKVQGAHRPDTIAGAYKAGGQRVLRGAQMGWAKVPRKHQDQARAIVTMVGTIVLLWVLSRRITLWVLLAVLTGLGLSAWHGRRAQALEAGTATSRLYPRRMWAAVLLRPLLLALWSQMHVHGGPWFVGLVTRPHSWWASIVTLAVIVWTVRREMPEPESSDNWWSRENLVADLFHPSVLPWKEEVAPDVRHLGPPRHDDLGTVVLLSLPGISWEALQAKHAALAARWSVPRRLLTIGPGDRTHGENVVRIWRGVPQEDTGPERSPLLDSHRTSWAKPVRIGVDMRGRVVRAITVGVHTLAVAKTRAGKTWLVRIIVGHGALDPAVDIYVINGKDKRGDWRALAPRCVEYVAVDDAESLAEAMRVLEDVRLLCKARKDADEHDLTPVILLLEEWFSVRDIARTLDDTTEGKTAYLKRLDGAAAALGSVASGYNVHILGLAQRGTADYVAMGLKANMGQRFVGMVADPKEVGWAIGFTPVGEAPSRAGEFYVQTDEDPAVLTQVDAITDAEWAEVCKRATEQWLAYRAQHAPVAEPEAPADVAASVDMVKAAPVVTLEGAVTAALAGGKHLSSTELLGRLPAAVAPGSPAALGKALAKVTAVEQGYVGSKRGWRLAGGGGGAVLADRQQNGRQARSQRLSKGDVAAVAVQP